ncbi:uncharacterized protein APUU_60124A [Aspergillus puulaauensis]|uniref:Integral membrane protein n=1 Tax=Aspergillus puulaauensis TaxID=1220207 RepID=A0A7R7XST1_9EURO|nr:uncharacterized protein APUU_60124A [Aspergillus puulaauensis]BCS27076.1 hypothetical protein APUU_60124A [Aspergillus puulaauensis]
MTDLWKPLSPRRFPLRTTSILVSAYIFLSLLAIRHYQTTSHRDPTSVFFDPSRAYKKHYSSTRLSEAQSFLNTAGALPRAQPPSAQLPTLCIGIVTVRRRDEQYVGLTVASLLGGLSKAERDTLLLYLRIANTNPAEHPVYAEEWTETLPDRLLTYSRTDPDFEQLQQWEEGGWYRNKPIYDYTALLRECYDSGAEYVAMIEDDTLAVKGWFRALVNALEGVQEKARGEWVYLRLFYMESLLGWNGEEVPVYFFWSVVVWAVVTGVVVLARARFKICRRLPNTVVWLISCVFVPSAIMLFCVAGRQTVWPIPTGVSEMKKYGCCSQGLVFPRSIIPRFLDKTDLTTDWLVDMMVEQIADSQGWSRWVLVPPLLQHIGATSSKGYGFDDTASSIWNFRFEEYKL